MELDGSEILNRVDLPATERIVKRWNPESSICWPLSCEPFAAGPQRQSLIWLHFERRGGFRLMESSAWDQGPKGQTGILHG